MCRPPVRLGGPVLKIEIISICYWGHRVYSGVAGVLFSICFRGHRIYSGVAGIWTAAFISTGWILSSNIAFKICSGCTKCKESNIVINRRFVDRYVT
jgi:hypothetical protein